MDLTQRQLVNRRLRLADGEGVTKYLFPFWDEAWKVPFFIVDRLGRGPAVLHPPVRGEKNGLLLSQGKMADLEELGSTDPARFHGLCHYDPWWVFRGMSGVSDEMKQAIFPTNIAKPFRWKDHHWKVHDVVVADDGSRVVAIVAKNDSFERHEFTAEEIDLAATWPKASARKR